jgi:Spy/CpxP family protein refolding chaperone
MESTMKKRVVALLLGAALVPAAVIASGEHRMEHRLERMAEHLQLNTQQQAEVKKIFETQRDKQRALRQETRGMIQAVLSDEQRATLARHREERRKRFCSRDGNRAHHGEHHGHGPQRDS